MNSSKLFSSLEEEVSSTVTRRLFGEWTHEDQAALDRRLATDTAFANDFVLADGALRAMRDSAGIPEMMRFREQALADARRTNARRWLGPNGHSTWRQLRIAAIAAGLVVLGALIQYSPWGYRSGGYSTGIGEQRTLELEDHSRITLDAKTRLTVRYTGESRTIELIEGQAQFSVAKDPARPFRVQAGEHTIVALGTVFTVDFTDRQIHVAMVEGRVAVVPRNPHPSSSMPPTPSDGVGSKLRTPSPSRGEGGSQSRMRFREGLDEVIELSAGEELHMNRDGLSTVNSQADLEAATAWRSGKVVFRTERLGDAVRRMNRYSRVQFEITDPMLAEESVSGVFEVGDTEAFIAGMQYSLPVAVSYRDSETVQLSFARDRMSPHP